VYILCNFVSSKCWQIRFFGENLQFGASLHHLSEIFIDHNMMCISLYSYGSPVVVRCMGFGCYGLVGSWVHKFTWQWVGLGRGLWKWTHGLCSVARKVTAGLASHFHASQTQWYIHLHAQWPEKGRWAPRLSSIRSTTEYLFTLGWISGKVHHAAKQHRTWCPTNCLLLILRDRTMLTNMSFLR